MGEKLKQIVGFLRGLERRQQWLLLGTAAATVGLLALFVHFFATPEMKPLYTGLTPADSQQVARRLAQQGIRFELSEDGSTIKVPADRLDQLRMQLATEGPPSSGRLGFELFDKPNWSGSDFSERINYQRALEGELERTIETLQEVEAARVHLVLPHDSLFTEQQRQGKAAVVVKLRDGQLSPAAVTGIARLVAGAVDNLPPENVTIIDAATGRPLLVREAQSANNPPTELETALAEKIVTTLAPIVGADQVRASVTIERDPSSDERTEESYDPNQAAVLTSQISDQSNGTAAPGGVAGTASNVPRSAAQPSSLIPGTGSQSLGLHSENKTFAVSKRVRHTIEPPGRIRRITAAVLVDDAITTETVNGQVKEVRRKRTPAEIKQIEDLVKASIGFDASRGDQVVVENLPFSTAPPTPVPPPPMAERILRELNRWMAVVRLGALWGLFLLAYLLLLRPLQRQLREALRTRAQPPPAPAAAPAAAEPIEKQFEDELAQANSTVQQILVLKRSLVDKVKHEPESATRLLEAWIQEKKAS